MKKLFTLFITAIAVLSAFAKTEVPEGTVQYYTRSGSFYQYDWDGLAACEQSGCVGVVINGNDVYIQNIVQAINNDMWVKGTLGEDGKTVTIPQDNVVMETSQWFELPSGDWAEFFGVLRLSMLNFAVVDGEPSFTRDTETPIQLLIEDNTITLLNTNADNKVLGAVYDEFEVEGVNGKWHIGADFNTVLTKFDEQPVTVPADATCADYVMKFHGPYSDETEYQMVKLYTSGDDIYVTGFYTSGKNMPFKCTRKDGKLHFDSNQFIGIGAGYIYEMVSANYSKTEPDEWGWSDLVYEDTKGVDFSIDEATGTYSLKKGEALRVTQRDNYYVNSSMFCDLELYPYVDELLTPQEPTIQDVADFYEMEGDWDVYFECPLTSVDEKPLNLDHLYFCFYINDELYTFDAERYELDADLVEVPYTLTDNEYLNHQTYFGIHNYIQEKNIQKVGVQLVYRVGDEVSRSPINEYIVEDTAIRELPANADTSTRKYLQKGGVVIERNGHIYNAVGSQLK